MLLCHLVTCEIKSENKFITVFQKQQTRANNLHSQKLAVQLTIFLTQGEVGPLDLEKRRQNLANMPLVSVPVPSLLLLS